ncbi:TPA: DNA-binding protein WhiA [bacterium]|jgi:DNA-binding protein WhiA|nr:DNA-binding protein WhiA [bacterium]
MYSTKESYASRVKEEILHNKIESAPLKAQLSAIIKVIGSIIIKQNKKVLKTSTENVKLARYIYSNLKSLYNVSPKSYVFQTMKLFKKYNYNIEISENVNEILNDLELNKDFMSFSPPSKSLLKNDECIRYYLSGVFLASGSVNSPENTNYHLEMAFNEEEHACFIMDLIRNHYNFDFKMIKRRNKYIVYLKKSDLIVEFLLIIGATNEMFHFEDFRSTRDIKNSHNRLNNMLIANEVKSLETAKEQVEAIKLIDKIIGIEKLDDRLKDVAYLRLENDEASLSELATLYEERTGNKISKSGINHRLKSLEKFAKSLK